MKRFNTINSITQTLTEKTTEFFQYIIDCKIVNVRSIIASLSLDELNSMKDPFDNNALHIAVTTKNQAIVELLLSKKMDMNVMNKLKISPYMIAVMNNDFEMIILLNTNKIMGYKIDMDFLKLDNDNLKKDVKRLREENVFVTEQNKKLKISVENLLNSKKH
jgi:ankyrin repeat protein